MRNIPVICCLIFSLTLFSQEKDSITVPKNMSVSIYTTLLNKQQMKTYEESIVPVLNLKDFEFMIFDQEDIRNDIFTIDLRNIGRKASSFSYDSYKDIDLYKHFPRVYDLRSIPWRQL